ncbi:TSP 1 domain containing protein [Asbolus verrucosus]|uniref:TSP 1 domain containing protein n=1 Tax=Asbolus verrucosus TaxID=1661398 RepID=A0A482VXH5_ASBVE|nr:TSP 1 domain containing protein [Asbolus verrucosus]
MTLRALCVLLLLSALCRTKKIEDCRMSIAHPVNKRGATRVIVMQHEPTFPKKRENRRPKKWDRWGRWSLCSVTCGVGKITRWRHCVAGGCAPGEKEAQIKTCTMSAC